MPSCPLARLRLDLPCQDLLRGSCEVVVDHVLVTLSLGVLMRFVQDVGLVVGQPLPDAVIRSILRLAFGTAVEGFAGYMRMISRVLRVFLTITSGPASLLLAHWFSLFSVLRCQRRQHGITLFGAHSEP